MVSINKRVVESEEGPIGNQKSSEASVASGGVMAAIRLAFLRESQLPPTLAIRIANPLSKPTFPRNMSSIPMPRKQIALGTSAVPWLVSPRPIFFRWLAALAMRELMASS